MKKLFVILMLPILLTNCHKNEATMSYSMTYITDSIKSLAFRSGSYWIYKADSSAQKDCTFVATTQAAFYEIEVEKDHTMLFECYSMNCNSVRPSGSSASQYFIETNHMLLDAVLEFPSAQGPVLFTFDTLTDWKRNTSVNRYIDSLRVGAKTFHGVQECKFSSGSVSYSYYTADSIGIVRKVIGSGATAQTWNLVKWNVAR
jgi:hypothetical protein